MLHFDPLSKTFQAGVCSSTAQFSSLRRHQLRSQLEETLPAVFSTIAHTTRACRAKKTGSFHEAPYKGAKSTR